MPNGETGGGIGPTQERPEVAFYYPGWVWRSPEHAKNLLLFFDGVALLVPEYMLDRPEMESPELAGPLREQGLLHLIKPEEAVDSEATNRLAEALTNVLSSDAFAELTREPSQFAALSYSRLGSHGERSVARNILEELQKRGLARESEDGLSIPIHDAVHSLILVFLSQILRPYGQKLDVELSPSTDQPRLVAALSDLVGTSPNLSAGDVVTTDLATVGVDLAGVALDEVLSFREEYGKEYRHYARSVRRFVREASLLAAPDKERALRDRQAELEDLAADLKRRSETSWKRKAAVGLSLTGAAWRWAVGDVVGAAIAGSAAILGAKSKSPATVEAHSYLFKLPNSRGYQWLG